MYPPRLIVLFSEAVTLHWSASVNRSSPNAAHMSPIAEKEYKTNINLGLWYSPHSTASLSLSFPSPSRSMVWTRRRSALAWTAWRGHGVAGPGPRRGRAGSAAGSLLRPPPAWPRPSSLRRRGGSGRAGRGVGPPQRRRGGSGRAGPGGGPPRRRRGGSGLAGHGGGPPRQQRGGGGRPPCGWAWRACGWARRVCPQAFFVFLFD